MKVFFDTNVLVAASVQQHPHFVRADALFRSCMSGSLEGVVHAHSLLEFHSAVTQLPGGLAVPAPQISTLLAEGILPYVQLVAISAEAVRGVQQQAGELDLIGGIIYDLYHLAVAEAENVERFYTFNVRHFKVIAQPDLRARIMEP